MSLEKIVDEWRPRISPEERQTVLSFLHKGFNYEPELRPTAAEVLDSAEFKALLEMYGC